MRKAVFIFGIGLLLGASVPGFSDTLDLGLSWTPVADKSIAAQEELDAIRGFHIGYALWDFVYFSWDALVIPPSIIEGWTGFYRPGFLNLYDGGIQLYFKPFFFYSEIGLNNVYVYKQGSNQVLQNNFGANLRLGLGLRWDWIGVNLSGTAVFHSFSSLTSTLAELANRDSRDRALQKIGDAIVPSFNFALYF